MYTRILHGSWLHRGPYKTTEQSKLVGGCLHGKGGLLSNTVLVAKCLSIRILILQCLFSVDPQSFIMLIMPICEAYLNVVIPVISNIIKKRLKMDLLFVQQKYKCTEMPF